MRIEYTGKVRQDTGGVFRLQDLGNWYILTQFESTDARAAFPSFDETAYKVPWQLTLHIPAQDGKSMVRQGGRQKDCGPQVRSVRTNHGQKTT